MLQDHTGRSKAPVHLLCCAGSTLNVMICSSYMNSINFLHCIECEKKLEFAFYLATAFHTLRTLVNFARKRLVSALCRCI